jgi:hypothetical protein
MKFRETSGWHRWFAWFPVRTFDGWKNGGYKIVWLEWVYRRYSEARAATLSIGGPWGDQYTYETDAQHKRSKT